MSRQHRDTIAVNYGINSDSNHGAVIPPLYLSSTFAFPSLNQKGKYDYTRTANPTRDQLAEALSALEQQMEELRQQLTTIVKSRAVHS